MNISVEQTSTIFFALAVVHTFLASQFQKFSHKFPKNSVKENIFHLLGEAEVVFGLWAGLYILFLLINQDFDFALNYLNSRNFTEPIFVFVVMSVCSTKPILNLALSIIESLAKLLPFNRSVSFFAVTLTVGPILGSFITEPAAMTVTALVLYQRYYSQGLSRSLMYSTLGVLFVNVSVGGTLTPYAAPPVIMVSSQWGWDLHFMLTQFGWKGVLACLLSTAFLCLRYRKELAAVKIESAPTSTKKVPPWIVATHVLFLALIVLTAHYMVFFTGLFLFFIGLYVITKTYQDSLDLKACTLVAFFLGGLVVLGGPQGWWVEPTIRSLDSTLLFLSSIGSHRDA